LAASCFNTPLAIPTRSRAQMVTVKCERAWLLCVAASRRGAAML
jgi:hypothetical protein